ncbi:MAG: hypothetical protein HN623_04065 [Bdellovibrionales bacterium]|nr:hypothetical protein [Bdellovibrionales bacterium]
MVSPNREVNITRWLLLLVVMAFLASCAKELPNDVSDDIQRTVHSLEAFSSTVTLESQGEGVNALTSDDVISDIYAVNAKEHRPVKMIEGPAALAPLFEGLKIESSQAGERFKVSFKLTKSYLVAYVDIRGHNLSSHMLALQVRESKKVPLFQYRVMGYGILENYRNSLDEVTPTSIFTSKDREVASHVKISHLGDQRILGGLAGLMEKNPESPILSKKGLDRKIWTMTRLGQFLKDGKLVGDQLVRTKVVGNNLYILGAVNQDQLSALESAALSSDPRDPRVMSCDQAMESALGDEFKGDCFLRPLFKKSVSHVITKLAQDEGDSLATVVLERNINVNRTDLVEVALGSSVVKATLDFDFKSPNIKYILKSKLSDNIIESDKLEQILKRKLNLGTDLLKTVVVGRLLYVLLPTQLDQLTKVERSFLDLPKDSRIQSCDQAMITKLKLEGDAAKNCVLVAKRIFNVAHMGASAELDSNDIPVFSPSSHADPTTSTLLRIDLTGELTPYQVAENIVDVDDILTNIKRDFDTDAEYLYVPMTLGTPREIRAANPFYQGEEKIVKLSFDKEGLNIYEVEEDERFGANQLNNYPVMTIPGNYVDFKCVEDGAKRCTGGDQMNYEISWEDKRFYMPKMERVHVKEVNILDVFTNNSSCIYMSDVKLLDYQIEAGVMNFSLEKTYQVSKSIPCIVELYYQDQMSSASFKVQFSYSLVRLKDLASKNYETIAYPLEEQRDFGFFKDKKVRLNDIYDHRRANEQYFLSRWNPKKEVLTYYLSDTFAKKSNALLKDATYKVFANLNRSLERANVGFKLKLEEPAGINPGDLRYNTIVMIDDPLVSGLLGYGPTVSNPRTGEIVQGHVNMYGGVLLSMTRRVYEEMVDVSVGLLEQPDGIVPMEITPEVVVADSNIAGTDVDQRVNFSSDDFKLPVGPLQRQQLRSSLKFHVDHGVNTEITPANVKQFSRRIQNNRESMLHRILSPEDKGKLSEEEKRIAYYAENSAYPVELLNTSALAKEVHPDILAIDGILRDNQKTLKRWTDLTAEQREQVVEIILPLMYIQTLTHEMGHSLGLRHNFMGSNDKANFYTPEEADSLGLLGDPTYSSIMDYAASDMNGLSIMGKYDVAALRFGYAREVETSTGEFVPVPTTLLQLKTEGVTLKSYQYCTDENAGLSPLCARFDEGSSLKEVISFYVQKYKDDYKYLNYRNGRNSFTSFGLGGYAGYVNYFMSKSRQIFEMFEVYYQIFSQGQGGPEFADQLMNDGCSDDLRRQYADFCAVIQDVVDANTMLGQHLLDIIKTPDHQCALAKEDQPMQLVELRLLKDIYQGLDVKTHVPSSCFDSTIKEQLLKDKLIPVAEGGKYLHSIKDPSPRYIYVSDIAVRGTWVDKLLAMKFLTSRFSGAGSVESGYYNMLKMNKISEQFSNLVAHLTLGAPLTDTVPFVTESGQKVRIPYQLPATQLIPEQTAGSIINYFNLPLRHSAFLMEKLLDVANRYNRINDPLYKDQARLLGDFFSLYRWKEYQSYNLNGRGIEVTIDDMTYGATDRHIFAHNMIEKLVAFERLPTMDQELVATVLLARVKPTLPDGLSADERIVIEVPDYILTQLLQIKKDGGTITRERLIEILGEELGSKADLAMQMETARLEELILIQSQLGQAPADASEEELYLYNLDLQTLEMYARGTLNQELINQLQFTLPLLPTNID